MDGGICMQRQKRDDLQLKIDCLSDSDYLIVEGLVNRLFSLCNPSEILKLAREDAISKGAMSEDEIEERISRIRKERRSESASN